MRFILTAISTLVLALPGAAYAQQVEYVTRTHVGHAIAFGPAPRVISTQTVCRAGDTQKRTHRQRHAIRFDARPLNLRLPAGYVLVNNAPHTVQVASEQAQARSRPSGVRTIGPGAKRNRTDDDPAAEPGQATTTDSETGDTETTDEDRSEKKEADDTTSSEVPSRHLLRVAAMLRTDLDCHR